MGPLEIIEREGATTNQRLSDYINDYFENSSQHESIDILEAGCGKKWNLGLSVKRRLTGVDLSREAIEMRMTRYNDINEMIVGDLAAVEIAKRSFDIVYCSYVLEHLDEAELVLDRFFDWLRPGGLAVLLFPDRDTVPGAITRFTPHWFHVAYYKYIEKFPHAGEPGHGPFPTYYDSVISREGIHNYCEDRGHKIMLEFATPVRIPASAGVLRPFITAFVKSLSVLSLGHLSGKHQNLILILRKE